jgi:hypothetical protein
VRRADGGQSEQRDRQPCCKHAARVDVRLGANAATWRWHSPPMRWLRQPRCLRDYHPTPGRVGKESPLAPAWQRLGQRRRVADSLRPPGRAREATDLQAQTDPNTAAFSRGGSDFEMGSAAWCGHIVGRWTEASDRGAGPARLLDRAGPAWDAINGCCQLGDAPGRGEERPWRTHRTRWSSATCCTRG